MFPHNFSPNHDFPPNHVKQPTQPKTTTKSIITSFFTKPILLPIWLWNLLVISIYLSAGYTSYLTSHSPSWS